MGATEEVFISHGAKPVLGSYLERPKARARRARLAEEASPEVPR